MKFMHFFIIVLYSDLIFSLMKHTDYIKFMCGKVMSGVGILPWVFFKMNKVIQWAWRKKPTEHHESY